MKRRNKISIAQAFDMVPMHGYMLMCVPYTEAVAEAGRRNETLSGEWWDVSAVIRGDKAHALVTRGERYDIAREVTLLGVMRFANNQI